MLKTQLTTGKLLVLFVIALLSFRTDTVCLSREMGELKLEGQHIEQLVLCRKNGDTEQFSKPDEVIKLPVGEYRIKDVQLKDGFIYNNRTLMYNWVTVSQDEPAILKVGAPLKQALKIERKGPTLVLNYELTGVGGETYVVTRSKHPQFTVFKGDKKIATSEFEFG